MLTIIFLFLVGWVIAVGIEFESSTEGYSNSVMWIGCFFAWPLVIGRCFGRMSRSN